MLPKQKESKQKFPNSLELKLQSVLSINEALGVNH